MAADEEFRPLTSLLNFARAHYIVLAVIGVTLVGAILRLYHLESMPPGLHGDEGWTGLDARRVLKEGWIGPYVPSALGQPSGPLYWTALVFELLGDGVLQLRMSMALLGIITIPVCYYAARQAFDARVGLFSCVMLTVLGWHLFYSRTGFMVISWPLAELAVIGLTFAAYRKQQPALYAAAGVALGLGVYTYNVYPLFILAFGIFLALLLLQSGRRFRLLLPNVAILLACAFIVALPMLGFVTDPKNDYQAHQRQVSVFQNKDYLAKDTSGRISYIADRAKVWGTTLTWDPKVDLTDGAGIAAVIDWTTALLAVGGIGICLANIRRPQYQLMLLMVLILPLGAILTTNAPIRRTLGLSPFIAILAALTLSYVWERLGEKRPTYRDIGRLGLVAIVIGIGFVNVRTYVRDVIPSETTRWTYADEIAEASKYAEAQPNHPYVYFFSARWSYDYETRRYIAPDLRGEDRSREFSLTRTIDTTFDRSHDSLVLLLPPYSETEVAPILALYADGQVYTSRRGNSLRFVAIKLPKREGVQGVERR